MNFLGKWDLLQLSSDFSQGVSGPSTIEPRFQLKLFNCYDQNCVHVSRSLIKQLLAVLVNVSLVAVTDRTPKGVLD